MFGADRPKPGVRNLSSRQGAAAFRRSLGHTRRPPGHRYVTGRELWGYDAPPLGLTSDVECVAEHLERRKRLPESS